MVRKYLKSAAPVVVALLSAASMILLPAKSAAMNKKSTVRDLHAFFTHSRSDSVAMCKADVKAIIREMRKYVNDGTSHPEEIEERNQKLDTIEDARKDLCEQNVISAMKLNNESWELVDVLRQLKAPCI